MRRALAVGLSAVVLSALPGAATATAEAEVSATLLAQGVTSEKIKVTGNKGTEVAFREITLAPGGSTGWHYHDGELLAVVESGTLTRTLADCSVVVSKAGSSLVEPAGRHRVHMGRNLGTEPVVLYVAYVLPEGSPPSRPAPAPDCAA